MACLLLRMCDCMLVLNACYIEIIKNAVLFVSPAESKADAVCPISQKRTNRARVATVSQQISAMHEKRSHAAAVWQLLQKCSNRTRMVTTLSSIEKRGHHAASVCPLLQK